MCRTCLSGTFPIMLPRSRRLALPALVVVAAVASSGAALAPAPLGPLGPLDDGFGLSDVQVVATPTPDDESYMYSVDVLRRGLEYSYDLYDDESESEGDWYPVTEARAFTPDLGLAPLTLGDATTPPLAGYGTAQNDLWAVSLLDEFDGDTVTLRVTDGSTTRTVDLPTVLGGEPHRADVAIWKNTALVAGSLVNLVTLDVVPFYDGECDRTLGAALADGLLAVHDVCEGEFQVYSISAAGVQESDLVAAPAFTVPGTVSPGTDLALSRGLLAWIDGPAGGGSQIRYVRLGSGEAGAGWIPVEAVRVVAQGNRILVVGDRSDGSIHDAWVFEAVATDMGVPVAHVEVLLGNEWTEGPDVGPTPPPLPAPDGEVALGSSVVGGELTGDVDVQYLPVDLYGRTLVWFAPDGSIKAGTVPALSGGAATVGTSGTPKVGEKLTVTGAGFAPGEEVAVWLQSTPVLLATGVAGADGRVSLDVTIPAATAVGAHTITLVGVESGWRADSAVTVAAAGNPGLRIDTGR